MWTPSYAKGITPTFKNRAHTKAASWISLKSLRDRATSLTSTVVPEELMCVRIHRSVLWGEFLQNTKCQSLSNLHLLFLYFKCYFTQAAAEKKTLKAVTVNLYLYHFSAICIIPLPQEPCLFLRLLAVLFFNNLSTTNALKCHCKVPLLWRHTYLTSSKWQGLGWAKKTGHLKFSTYLAAEVCI